MTPPPHRFGNDPLLPPNDSVVEEGNGPVVVAPITGVAVRRPVSECPGVPVRDPGRCHGRRPTEESGGRTGDHAGQERVPGPRPVPESTTVVVRDP